MSASAIENPQTNAPDQGAELVDYDKARVMADAENIGMEVALEHKAKAEAEEAAAVTYDHVVATGSMKGFPKGLNKPSSPDFARLMSQTSTYRAEIHRKKEQDARDEANSFAEEVGDEHDYNPEAAAKMVVNKQNEVLVNKAILEARQEKTKISRGDWDNVSNSGLPSENTLAKRGGRISAS